LGRREDLQIETGAGEIGVNSWLSIDVVFLGLIPSTARKGIISIDVLDIERNE
jgi:hypothetical protein